METRHDAGAAGTDVLAPPSRVSGLGEAAERIVCGQSVGDGTNFVLGASKCEEFRGSKFLTFRCPQYEICPDGLSTRPRHHLTAL